MCDCVVLHPFVPQLQMGMLAPGANSALVVSRLVKRCGFRVCSTPWLVAMGLATFRLTGHHVPAALVPAGAEQCSICSA
ncbi:hypothetical protein ABBQ38_001883 [Trebouxia sp. C0009 RCD-2024]